MKKNLTLLIFIIGCMTFGLMAQGVINVQVQGPCGEPFTKPLTITLRSGNNQIATSTTNPTQFTGLDPFSYYIIEVESSDHAEANISLKDVVTLRDAILLGSSSNATYFTGDVNGNSGLSTLDIVLMSRDLIEIQELRPPSWIFIDESKIVTPAFNYDYAYFNQTTLQGLPNSTVDVTFKAFKESEAYSTTKDYCENSCTLDSTRKVSLLFPDIDLVNGKETTFTLSISRFPQDVGNLFSLNYKDIQINDIKSAGNSIFNQTALSINIINNYYFDWMNFKEPVITLNVTPKKSGKLASFFSINPDFKNEFLYKDGDCLLNYYEFEINQDSLCPVTWPLDITVPSCDSVYYTGIPKIDDSCLNVITVTYTDQVIGNPCEKTLRTWTAKNWLTGDIFNHTQVITYGSNNHICYQFTVFSNGSVTIYATDFIANAIPNHIYSFSPVDPNQTSKTFFKTPPFVEDLYVFDITDGTYCVAQMNVLGQGCSEPVHIKPVIYVYANGSNYTVTASAFDAGNVNHCLGVIDGFEIKNPNTGLFTPITLFDYQTYKNTTLNVDLRYRINGNYVNNDVVKIVFLPGNELPPFEITCFNDPLVKNQPFEISFFSPTFKDVYGIQAAFRLNNAILVSTRKIALEDLKTNEELHSLRFIWTLPSAQPMTLTGSDTLFTMTILPTENGQVSDVISIADDILTSEAVLNDLSGTKVALVFKFMKRSSSSSDLVDHQVSIYPNPSGTGDFTIQMPKMTQANIEVFTENGQKLMHLTKQSIDDQFALSLPKDASNGLYLVRISDDQHSIVKKLFLMR